MSLFDFLFAAPHEQRLVDRFEQGDVIVDTCAVNDSTEPFETGVSHPDYNAGDWVIVELYATETAAQKGHAKWVKKMTAKRLPAKLRDVSTAESAQLAEAFGGSDWREYKRKEAAK